MSEITEIQTSKSIKNISAAFARAQAKMPNAGKNSENESFQSGYANLKAVRDVCVPALNSENIGVLQFPARRPSGASLLTRLQHSSGEYIQGLCSAPLEKNDAHGLGSAITYLRRYCLAAMCGVAQEDDDGNAASQVSRQTSRSHKEEERTENAGPLIHRYKRASTHDELKQVTRDARLKWKLFTKKQTEDINEAALEAKRRLGLLKEEPPKESPAESAEPKPEEVPSAEDSAEKEPAPPEKVNIDGFLEAYSKAITRQQLSQVTQTTINVIEALTEAQKETLERASREARERIDALNEAKSA